MRVAYLTAVVVLLLFSNSASSSDILRDSFAKARIAACIQNRHQVLDEKDTAAYCKCMWPTIISQLSVTQIISLSSGNTQYAETFRALEAEQEKHCISHLITKERFIKEMTLICKEQEVSEPYRKAVNVYCECFVPEYTGRMSVQDRIDVMKNKVNDFSKFYAPVESERIKCKQKASAYLPKS
ncbi:hypothetical protein [Pleionea sp. CnH1-48]|uniref:hypothetical protein n=1 Tax=Pleionea sp. CnH1-48 TaxID=2954494 RepID=UPI00209807B9|nr:hypothetical protein [Pleionea sp. CnH1-48]MCO7226975.1 hypothetical protein [Pleionea sp. CnH1-48]